VSGTANGATGTANGAAGAANGPAGATVGTAAAAGASAKGLDGRDQAVNLQGHYAGAVTRLAAYVVDQAVVVGAYSVGVAAVTWILSFVSSNKVHYDPPAWFSALTFGLWWLVYFAYPWTLSGKTIGMALLGIRVVRRDGSRCGAKAATLRAATFPLGFITLGIGFLGILFGRERRAIYDRIAGTAVVYSWDAKAARWRFLARQGDVGTVEGAEA
jgi:uncharacterized RDD family membrane protein YckC